MGLSNRLVGVVRHGFARVHGASLPLLDPSQADGAVSVSVRPEDLEFGAAGAPGVVLSSSFHGSLRRTRVRLDDGASLVVQHGARLHPSAGDRVLVRFTGAPVSVDPLPSPA